jgi:hypothetical protein
MFGKFDAHAHGQGKWALLRLDVIMVYNKSTIHVIKKRIKVTSEEK